MNAEACPSSQPCLHPAGNHWKPVDWTEELPGVPLPPCIKGLSLWLQGQPEACFLPNV
jgi:hypothetical protein